MATVLYPTRGGDRTHRNQDRAAALARERDANLVFLYVSNVSFLDRLGGTARIDILEEELDDLGEFLLAMAQERAERSGVKTERAIRHGRFRPALSEVIEEYGVTTLILGRPAHDDAITTVDYITQAAQTMAADHGIEVLVLHEGEVVEEYRPGTAAADG
jgi:nucleotide-binding universal stress UspA family protein